MHVSLGAHPGRSTRNVAILRPKEELAGNCALLGLKRSLRLRLRMQAFIYVLSVEQAFSEAELPKVTEEMCKLLRCTGISVSHGQDFTVHSPLAFDELDGRVKELSRKFGAQFKAGGKVE